MPCHAIAPSLKPCCPSLSLARKKEKETSMCPLTQNNAPRHCPLPSSHACLCTTGTHFTHTHTYSHTPSHPPLPQHHPRQHRQPGPPLSLPHLQHKEATIRHSGIADLSGPDSIPFLSASESTKSLTLRLSHSLLSTGLNLCPPWLPPNVCSGPTKVLRVQATECLPLQRPHSPRLL